MKIAKLVRATEDHQHQFIGCIYEYIESYEEHNGDRKIRLRNVETGQKRTEYLKNLRIFDNEVKNYEEAIKVFK